MPSRANRCKISTTVAPETDAFLKSLVRRGKAANLAEAVDRAVAVARRAESRRKLEAATAAYYESLSQEDIAEETALGLALSHESGKVNFDE
jgi:methylthioribose-1-phosphate isomerase